MRSTVTARARFAVLAALLAGCATTAPPTLPATPAATPAPTEQPTTVPAATLAAPGGWLEPGWTVVAVHDASGDRQVVSADQAVRGGTYFDVGFACQTPGQIIITVVDMEAAADDPARTHARFEAPCKPHVSRSGGPAPDADATLGVVVESAPGQRYWAELAVPEEYALP